MPTPEVVTDPEAVDRAAAKRARKAAKLEYVVARGGFYGCRRGEWTTAEWLARPVSEAEKATVYHDPHCAGSCGHVFVCRGNPFACGRHVGGCTGGDDDRCSECWCRAEHAAGYPLGFAQEDRTSFVLRMPWVDDE